MTVEAGHSRESSTEGNPAPRQKTEETMASGASSRTSNSTKELIDRLMSGRVANFSETPPR